MSREYLTPGKLLGFAIAVQLLLLVGAYADRSPECVQRQRDLFGWLFIIAGPISLLAVFGGIAAYGVRERWHPIGTAFAAVAVSVLWAVVVLFFLVWITVPGDCFN